MKKLVVAHTRKEWVQLLVEDMVKHFPSLSPDLRREFAADMRNLAPNDLRKKILETLYLGYKITVLIIPDETKVPLRGKGPILLPAAKPDTTSQPVCPMARPRKVSP